jgi:hypothetical protein
MQIDVLKKIRTETTTRRQIKLNGKTIIAMVNQELATSGDWPDIPANAKVKVWIPGGADWSNTDLDIDDHTLVEIEWTTTETEVSGGDNEKDER